MENLVIKTKGIIHHFYDYFSTQIPRKAGVSYWVSESKFGVFQWVDFLVCGLVSKPVLKYDNSGLNLTSENQWGFLSSSISGIMPIVVIYRQEMTFTPFQASEMHHHFKLHLHHHHYYIHIWQL